MSEEHYPSSPEIALLAEDTITFFSVPKNSELTITYHHVYAYGDAIFRLFDNRGQLYDEVVFNYNESGFEKTITFDNEGIYKMVAIGVSFRYHMKFSGSPYDWKCVVAAMPHKAIFRVKNNEAISAYFKLPSKQFKLHMSNNYAIPQRDATIKIYDETNSLQTETYMDSTDFLLTYEHIEEYILEYYISQFWKIEIEGHGGGQSRVVVWTNTSEMNLATGHCTFLTPDPAYYFIPRFSHRTINISFTKGNHQASVGSSGYFDIHNSSQLIYGDYTKELNIQTSKHWVSWFWRERQGATSQNDDEDPFHINWEGFNMDPFDQRMLYYRKYNIQPILCLQWDEGCFINTHPAYWDKNEIDEFAEYCLAMAIHCVAPNLKSPPLDREPYLILGIMPLNEPNLIFSEKLGLYESIEKYLEILVTIGERFRGYPDSRIQNITFAVPGISPHLYGNQELVAWIEAVVNNASEYADIIMWDQYSKYLLEELSDWGGDVEAVKNIVPPERCMGLSEFGIHGGIPTIQEFYGSSFAKLFVFGALANCINKGMTYPIYFMLIDSIFEPRLKGLLTGTISMPPFSDLPPFIRKPQFYAMQIMGNICNGTILTIENDISQIDIIGSSSQGGYRFGISNRYESSTTVNLPIEKGTLVHIFNVADDGIKLIKKSISNGMVNFDIPKWSLYYLECGNQSFYPSADLYCEGYLHWGRVPPGETVTGQFTVSNIGDNGTLLDWKILSYPDWGSWHFLPAEGLDLTPEERSMTVNVTVVAPEENFQIFNDFIVVGNIQDENDQSSIAVSLSTPISLLTFFSRFIYILSQNHGNLIDLIKNIYSCFIR